MSSINQDQRPQYQHYQRINVPTEYTNIVIGKKFKNINNIKSLSPVVNVAFISDREQGNNRFIVKSNDKTEFDRVMKNIKTLMNSSYTIYQDIKKQEKENRKVQAKLREIQVRKELSKKIEKEMQEREMEQIKLECIGVSNHKAEKEHNATKKAYERSKGNNPFYGLEIEDDEE
jgi:hypothetical protein